MSKSSNIGINNINKKIKTLMIGGGNLSKKSSKAYIGVNNTAKEWSGEEEDRSFIAKFSFSSDRTVQIYVSYDHGNTWEYKNNMTIGYTTYPSVIQYSKALDKWTIQSFVSSTYTRRYGYYSEDGTLGGTFTAITYNQLADNVYIGYTNGSTRTELAAYELVKSSTGAISAVNVGSLTKTNYSSYLLYQNIAADGDGSFYFNAKYTGSSESNSRYYPRAFHVANQTIDKTLYSTTYSSSIAYYFTDKGKGIFAIAGDTDRYRIPKANGNAGTESVGTWPSSTTGNNVYFLGSTELYSFYRIGSTIYRSNKDYGTLTSLGTISIGTILLNCLTDEKYVYMRTGNVAPAATVSSTGITCVVYRMAENSTTLTQIASENNIFIAYRGCVNGNYVGSYI